MSRHTTDSRIDAPASPAFRDLSAEECQTMLSRHHVGRLAYTFRGRVSIAPLNYVYADGLLYGRTSPGSKLATLAHHPWVALEVDEVEDVFSWRSVMARGTFYRVERIGGPAARRSWHRAVELLDGIIPGTLTSSDPVPFRYVVFYIAVDELTGREAFARAVGPPG